MRNGSSLRASSVYPNQRLSHELRLFEQFQDFEYVIFAEFHPHSPEFEFAIYRRMIEGLNTELPWKIGRENWVHGTTVLTCAVSPSL